LRILVGTIRHAGHGSSGGVVFGALAYDFSNELGQSLGKLNIININGDIDAARIAASRLLDVPAKPLPAKNVTSPGSVTPTPMTSSPYSYP
jgi:hypothetical protein